MALSLPFICKINSTFHCFLWHGNFYYSLAKSQIKFYPCRFSQVKPVKAGTLDWLELANLRAISLSPSLDIELVGKMNQYFTEMSNRNHKLGTNLKMIHNLTENVTTVCHWQLRALTGGKAPVPSKTRWWKEWGGDGAFLSCEEEDCGKEEVRGCGSDSNSE